MKETLCSGSIFAAVSLPRSCRACAGSSCLTPLPLLSLSLSQLPGLLWFFLPHPLPLPSLSLAAAGPALVLPRAHARHLRHIRCVREINECTRYVTLRDNARHLRHIRCVRANGYTDSRLPQRRPSLASPVSSVARRVSVCFHLVRLPSRLIGLSESLGFWLCVCVSRQRRRRAAASPSLSTCSSSSCAKRSQAAPASVSPCAARCRLGARDVFVAFGPFRSPAAAWAEAAQIVCMVCVRARLRLVALDKGYSFLGPYINSRGPRLVALDKGYSFLGPYINS